MDPTALLDLERRTGVKNEDIDDFVRKATELERAIKGLSDGTLKPEEVKIEGIETEEEKERKKKEREEKQRIQKEKQEQLCLQRKQEEIERWWAGAEIYKPKNDEEVANNAKGIVREEAGDGSGVTKDMLKDKVVGRYTMDYSKWDTWIPDDDATRQEQLEREREEEEKRNKEFENNNPDFCKQFMIDMEERKKNTQKKQESADILRLKGNRYFKNKDFQQAIDLYMDALKNCPFDCKLLLNIAQAQIKMKVYEDALEFLARTLYLEPMNVKALSRKAFVLAELGRTAEALEAVNTAVALEPTNAELVAQQREITVIEEEKRQEEKLKQLSLGKTSVSMEETKSSQESVVVAAKASKSEESVVASQTSATQSVVRGQAQANESQAMQLIDELKASLDKFSAEQAMSDDTLIHEVQSVKLSLDSFPLLKVHFRNSNIIPILLNVLKSQWTTLKSSNHETTEVVSLRIKLVEVLLNLLNVAIDGQRSSKQSVIDNKGYTALKTMLEDLSEPHLPIVHETIAFIHILCKDDICTKSRAAVFSDKSIIAQLSNVMGNLNHNLKQSLTALAVASASLSKEVKGNKMKVSPPSSSSAVIPKAMSAKNLQIAHETIKMSLQILKVMLFTANDTNVKTMLTSQDPVCAATLVCAVACVLHHYFEVFKMRGHSHSVLIKGIEQDSSFTMEEMLELAIEVMLGLSQLENMRSAFTVPLPLSTSTNHSHEGSGERSAIYAVIQVIKTLPVYSTNAIAILMNSSLSTPASAGSGTAAHDEIKVKQVIYRDGGLDIAISDLSLSETERAKISDDGVMFARKAGLLSRLVSLPQVQTVLMESHNYRMICRRIFLASNANTIGNNASMSNGMTFSFNKWVVDEHLHFIRVLAALPAPSSETLKQIAVEEKIFDALMSLFPKPREECGEITPTSVTLVPLNSTAISPQLIGNAARCLMPYADDQKYGPILYKEKKLMTIEKWICAMATCTDMRVRKNIAILLAKACRIPGVREKVTHFRGLQMMIELQDKL